MPLDLLDRIRTFPLFLSAPDSFLAAIGMHLRPQLHSPHDYILTEGDDAKAMYWLVRGAVAVTSRDGESTFAELAPGAFFGEIGVLMDIPRTATIIARTRCMLVVLKKEDLTKELPKFPDVERAIRDEASERLSILQRKKKENFAVKQAKSTAAVRGEKRARDREDGDIEMADSNSVYSNGAQINKKRKSPSPGLVEAAASSALGDGLVNVRQLLKELPLFSGLPHDILHFLGLNAQPCSYPPFTEIIKQDSVGREVFFIVRGEVEVIDEKAPGQNSRMLANGSRRNMKRNLQVKARLKPGQYFGEVVSLALAPRRTATVRSISSVECLMITGDVLANFWRKCPPTLRQQVEATAKQRLLSRSEEDVEMTDIGESTPPIDELAIGDRKTYRRNSVPIVAFSQSKAESPHKPTRIEDRPVIQPADPDPFLNVDLDNIRSRSRRGSLAPPTPQPPEGTQQANGTEPHSRRPSPPGLQAGTLLNSKPKHAITPPDLHVRPKRVKPLPQRTNGNNQGVFPNNVLIGIFQHLELHHLMRLRSVSLQWSKLLKESPNLLHLLDLAMYNRILTDDILINRICPFIGARPRVVDLSNCFHITDEGFAALSSACGANIISWRMKSVWDITAQAVLEMANRAKSLEEVDLSNCRKVSDNLLARVIGWVVQGSPPNGNHQNLHGRQAAARSVGAPLPPQPPPGTVFGCPKLKKLTLSYCKHVTDRSMAHMAYHAAPRLEQIDLTRCTTITDQGFQHWGQFQFSRLTKLCLADCTYLTDNAIVYLTNAAKGLRDLDLVRRSSITYNGNMLNFLSHFAALCPIRLLRFLL